MSDLENFEKYAKHIDYHIRSLVDMTDIMRGIKNSIDKLITSRENSYQASLNEMKDYSKNFVKQLEKIGIPKLDSYEMQLNSIKEKLENANWPVAVNPEVLSRSNEELADQILNFIVTEYFEGKKFLQYKCGTGHIVEKVSEQGAKMSVGFDLKREWEFSNSSNVAFTTDFGEVRKHGSYDTILFYNALDHMQDPVAALIEAKSVLNQNGKIYLRMHPWCSQHGGDLYKKINKAYLHLILSEDELMRLGGYKLTPTLKVTKPLQTYREWIEQAGLEIETEMPIDEEISTFFTEDAVLSDRLERVWKGEYYKPYASIQFVDYVLTIPQKLNEIF